MNYDQIFKHYEVCFEQYGDNHKGVDWPNYNDAQKRYEVMTELFTKFYKRGPNEWRWGWSLLDFGCGLSHYYEYLQEVHPMTYLDYTGLDISQIFVNESRNKYIKNKYLCLDILKKDLPEKYDFIVANGTFTEKVNLSYEDMFDFFNKVVVKLFDSTRKGLAFNVMSKHVDWERDDLFHVSFDDMAAFLKKDLSSNFVFRQDYGLREYTVYIYK